MGKKINYLSVLILIIMGCSSKKHSSEDSIIGKWQGSTDWINLTLVFTKEGFSYYEKVNNLKFDCRYKIKDDTLFLLRGDSSEKHFIYKVNKKELKFNAENPGSVDVSDIDGINFKRVSN